MTRKDAHSEKYSPVYCAACGRQMGTKPGKVVTLGLLCDDPICSYQGVVSANIPRDALIVAAALDGVPASQIAFSAEMSRQRVYQIVDTWKQGV